MSATSHIQSYVDYVAANTGTPAAEALAAIEAEARRSVREALGDDPVDFEVTLDRASHELVVRQRFRVVDTVATPSLEVTRDTVRTHGQHFHDDGAGVVSLPILYTYAPDETKRMTAIDAALGALVDSSRVRTALWTVLDEAIGRVMSRYIPVQAFPVGTIGHALANQGWPVGRRHARSFGATRGTRRPAARSMATPSRFAGSSPGSVAGSHARGSTAR